MMDCVVRMMLIERGWLVIKNISLRDNTIIMRELMVRIYFNKNINFGG